MTSANEPDLVSGSPVLVSVIIPSYNTARYIQETLDSVFAQTYPHYQVIVVNDGSPDTPELELVLRPYIERITYIKQENRGLAGARNTGLRAAVGSMVALLDSDDIWLPDYLAEQVKFLQEHSEFSLVYCNARLFGDPLFAGKDYMAVCPSNGEATAAAIISQQCNVYVSVTARRRALLAVGFDESLRSCEDFECWIRFAAAGYRIGYHRKVLVLCRRHSDSLSNNVLSMAKYKFLAIDKSLSLWPPGSTEYQLLIQAREAKAADLETFMAKAELRSSNFPAAIRHFKAANEYYKSRKTAIVIALLKVAPGLVLAVTKLRSALLPAYREPDSQRE